MTPGPTLDQLIATVRTDADRDDPLDQLETASRTVAELEEVADAALSHFVDQCRRSGRSWTEISRALGVTKQAAHKRFSLTTPTLDRWTQRAQALLEHAVAEARRLRHHYVGTEHILLALLADAESLAAKVLADIGIARPAVEAALLEVTPRGTTTVDAPPFTPRAATCLEKSVSEALQLGHNYVGTEHILLALFADPEGLAARILLQLGATYDDARERVIAKLANYVFTKKS